MTSPEPVPEAYEFGPFRALSRSRELLADGVPVELGSRAFDILMVLIEAPGALVTKDQLLTSVWPTVIVEENTLQSHIHALRKALGNERNLIVTVPGRGYRFVGEVRPVEGRAPSFQRSDAGIASTPRSLGNLPAGLSPLVGRVAQLQEVLALLTDHRLVTLTGPGGIGKTRLALEAARGRISAYRDGVWLVELGSLSNPDLVGTAILAATELWSGAIRASHRQFKAAFGDKHMLVVLDNCEHVIGAAARIVEDLLGAAPTVRILATSREPLGSESEYIYHVPPLGTPPADVRGIDEILRHDAVQLYVARVKATASGFALDEDTGRAVAAICRRLDGIPLAIELAAARSTGLGVRALADRLDQLFDLLSRGRRTALPRQQTLRATLDWSYGLLPEDQRLVLRRTAVFAGGFALHAASALAGDPCQPESTLVDRLTDLVAKSLIVSEVGSTEPRFRLLETTRAYALTRLDESGESGTLKRRHAEYYRDLLAAAAATPDGMNTGNLRFADAREIDNVRAALGWSFASAADPSLAFSLAASSVPLWFEASLPNECQAWLEKAIASIDAAAARGTRLEMLAQAGLGMSLMLTRPAGQEAEAALLRALELADALDDKDCQLRVLNCLVIVHLRRADVSAALACARKLEGSARDAASAVGAITAQRLAGVALHFAGDQGGALASLRAAIDRDAPMPRRAYAVRFGIDHLASARCFLANVLWMRGLPDRAIEAMRDGIYEARRAGHVVSLCHALAFGGTVTALRIGDFPAAEEYANELLRRADEISSEIYRTYGLAARAVVRARAGDITTGVEFLHAALGAIRESGTWVLSLMFSADFADLLAASGRAEEALPIIEEGLQISDRGGGYGAVAELLRVKGEAYLATDDVDTARSAEQAFAQAIDWARRQRALSWELRAATSLARLRQRQGRSAEGHDALAPVYTQFSEGFETLDLKRAKTLLDQLA